MFASDSSKGVKVNAHMNKLSFNPFPEWVDNALDIEPIMPYMSELYIHHTDDDVTVLSTI